MNLERIKSVLLIGTTIGLIISFFWIRSLIRDQMFSENLVTELRQLTEQKIEIPETKIIKDLKSNQVFAKTEIIPKLSMEKSMPVKVIKYYEDTLKINLMRAANLKKDMDLKEYINVIGKLKGELSAKNALIGQSSDSILELKGKYLTVLTDLKDQTTKYSYDSDLDFAIVKEKGVEYLYATSKDSSFTFSKNSIYKKQIIPVKDKFRISMTNTLNFGMKGPNDLASIQWRPFFMTSGLRMTFNPDGLFRPNLGGSYMVDLNNGQSYWLGTIGLDLKLLER